MATHRNSSGVVEQLVNDNIGLVHSRLVKMYPLSKCDYEDCRSAAYEALFNAARLFDSDRGFAFSTYACHAINNAIVRVWQAYCRRYKREIRVSDLVGDESREDIADTTPVPGSIHETDHGDDIARMCSLVCRLPDSRLAVILHDRYVLGTPLKAVGRKLGLSQERVRQLQLKAIKMLRDMFDEEAVDEAA